MVVALLVAAPPTPSVVPAVVVSPVVVEPVVSEPVVPVLVCCPVVALEDTVLIVEPLPVAVVLTEALELIVPLTVPETVVEVPAVTALVDCMPLVGLPFEASSPLQATNNRAVKAQATVLRNISTFVSK